MKIAVSYRRNDESDTLTLLLRALIDRFGEKNVYVDVESSKLGESWLARWAGAYLAADCVLVVIGPNWNPERLRNRRDPVRIELGVAWYGVTVVPLLIDGAKIPEPRQLPRTLRWLIGKQGFVIDKDEPAENIASFLDQLNLDTSAPAGWFQKTMSPKKIQETPFDLTGKWQWQSSKQLFDEVFIQQDGFVVELRALSAYGDEVVGEGIISLGDYRISFMLQSKRFGPAGFLVLKHCADTDTVTGRWQPAGLPLITMFGRKRVTLIRK